MISTVIILKYITVFTARCYTERGIATASRPSACLSVCDIEVSWSHKLNKQESPAVADKPARRSVM